MHASLTACHEDHPFWTWRELVEVRGYPFLKTELLARNPIGVSDVDSWRLLPPPPREVGQTIATHLNLMRRGRDVRF
jgi:hypothetical protein